MITFSPAALASLSANMETPPVPVSFQYQPSSHNVSHTRSEREKRHTLNQNTLPDLRALECTPSRYPRTRNNTRLHPIQVLRQLTHPLLVKDQVLR